MFGELSSAIVVICMVVLAILLSRHYGQSKNLSTLWWAVSFWLATLAGIMDLISYIMQDWTLWQYRLYLFSAATLVAYMGAGTMYLLFRRIGHIYVAVMSVIALVMVMALLTTPFPMLHMMPAGEKASGFVPGAIAPYFALLSGIGATAVFVGAVISFFKLRKAFTIWIALGVVLFSIGGSLGDALHVYELFYVFQAIGSIVLYLGITQSFRPRRQSVQGEGLR